MCVKIDPLLDQEIQANEQIFIGDRWFGDFFSM